MTSNYKPSWPPSPGDLELYASRLKDAGDELTAFWAAHRHGDVDPDPEPSAGAAGRPAARDPVGRAALYLAAGAGILSTLAHAPRIVAGSGSASAGVPHAPVHDLRLAAGGGTDPRPAAEAAAAHLEIDQARLDDFMRGGVLRISLDVRLAPSPRAGLSLNVRITEAA